MRVSIGIPFFNARATLADAIRSVFAQTFQDWELILVNDGSQDTSLDIARAVNDPRVQLIDDRQHLGLIHRLNELAARSRGVYIARMDDDDMMHPERLERQIQYLDANPAVHLAGSSVYTINTQNRISGARLLTTSNLTWKHVIATGGLIHPTITGRAAWFKQNLYDPRFVRAEDHELWCRTFPNTKFHIVPEPLMFYREGRSRTIHKYLTSGCSDRRIFATYGPAAMGWRSTGGLIAKSLLKDAIYCGLWTCGIQDLAFKRTRAALSPEERQVAQQLLSHVRSVNVPGLCPIQKGTPMQSPTDCVVGHATDR